MNWELLQQALSQIEPSSAFMQFLIPALIAVVTSLIGRKGGGSQTPATPPGDMGLPPELQSMLQRLLQGQERQIGNLDPLQQAVSQMAMKRLPTRYQQAMPWSPSSSAPQTETTGPFDDRTGEHSKRMP